jgi:rhodanese-related sulfurtransferase
MKRNRRLRNTTRKRRRHMKKSVWIIALTVMGAGIASNALACASCGCSSATKKTAVKASCGSGGSCGKKAEAKQCSSKKSCSSEAKATCSSAARKSCKSSCTRAKADHGYTTVDTDGLKKLIASEKDLVIVDARSGKYDDGRRIASAQQLGAASSSDAIAKALPDKDAKIVAYCTSTKCPASAALAHKLVDLGYKNVVKYPAGIEGWVTDGNDVSK